MQNLTQENIKFIDNYLQKSEVFFVDVRAELTDHIASAVEEKMEVENIDFYDAFKDFMVHNKKEILKPKNYFLPSILSFGKTLYKPYNLVIGLLTITSLYFLSGISEQQNILKTIHFSLFYGILSFVILQAIYIYLILRKRFAFLEKSTFSLVVIYYLNLFFNGFYTDFYGNSFTVGIKLFLFLAFLIYWFLTLKRFNKKYAYL